MPNQLLFGIVSMVGAIGYAGYSIWQKKQKETKRKKFELDWKKVADTAWQSGTAGYLAGMSIGCGWTGLLTTLLIGVGVDKLTNKIGFKKKQLLNLVQLVGDFLTKIDKKKKKK